MKCWRLFFLFILTSIISNLVGAEPEVTHNAYVMPRVFMFGKLKYKVSERINTDKNITIQCDLDNDGILETIVGFQAAINSVDLGEQLPRSFLAIGNITGEKLSSSYIIPGNDYFDKLELKDMDGDGLLEIVFWQSAGDHYTSLDIYKYYKGKIKHIFKDGSSCSVRIEGYDYPYTIKVGREKWDEKEWCHAQGTERYEAYVWKGNKFVYHERLSTSRLVGEGSAASRYAKEMSERANTPKGFIVVGQEKSIR